MGACGIKDREERLLWIGAVPPVRVRTEFVPCRQRRVELVVGLYVVRTVVTRPTQLLGEALHIVWQYGRIGRGQLRSGGVGGPVVVRADRDRVHACDDRRSGRGTNPRCREAM